MFRRFQYQSGKVKGKAFPLRTKPISILGRQKNGIESTQVIILIYITSD